MQPSSSGISTLWEKKNNFHDVWRIDSIFGRFLWSRLAPTGVYRHWSFKLERYRSLKSSRDEPRPLSPGFDPLWITTEPALFKGICIHRRSNIIELGIGLQYFGNRDWEQTQQTKWVEVTWTCITSTWEVLKTSCNIKSLHIFYRVRDIAMERQANFLAGLARKSTLLEIFREGASVYNCLRRNSASILAWSLYIPGAELWSGPQIAWIFDLLWMRCNTAMSTGIFKIQYVSSSVLSSDSHSAYSHSACSSSPAPWNNSAHRSLCPEG